METASHQSVLVFGVEDRRFALRLSLVDRVVRAVEVTSVPGAPSLILGVINLHGQIVPVVNTRRRLGLCEREVEPRDQFIIGHTATRTIALVADSVEGVFAFSDESMTAGETFAPEMNFVQGVLKTEVGLVLVHELERFLSPEDFAGLDVLLAT